MAGMIRPEFPPVASRTTRGGCGGAERSQGATMIRSFQFRASFASKLATVCAADKAAGRFLSSDTEWTWESVISSALADSGSLAPDGAVKEGAAQLRSAFKNRSWPQHVMILSEDSTRGSEARTRAACVALAGLALRATLDDPSALGVDAKPKAHVPAPEAEKGAKGAR